MFEIEKGIKVKSKSKYPLSEMLIDDSFFVAEDKHPKFAAASIHARARRLGIKLTVRKADGGWRVWRIA